jgi:hypothetical protein
LNGLMMASIFFMTPWSLSEFLSFCKGGLSERAMG